MIYEILARKWRPQSFKDIVGQECTITAISNSLNLGRIHHAWLFSGTRGIGKTSIARLLAKSLNCQTGITENPCRKCIICKNIEKGICLDFIEIDAASRTKVEDMHEILESVCYAPTQSRFKVYLIDEVHMLSRYSFNSLLKTLEEPPLHAKFILATTEPERIPKTIISRCLYFKLKSISEKKIFNLLKYILIQESIQYDQYSLEKISDYAKGSIRDALNLLEYAINLGNGTVYIKNIIKIIGIPSEEQTFLLTKAILRKDFDQTMLLLDRINNTGTEWEEILIEILRFLYHISILQSFPSKLQKNLIKIDRKKIEKIAKDVHFNDVQLCYKIVLNGRKELPFSPNLKIGVEMTLLRAINRMENYKK